jgi:lipopolysaccharide biosynthesis regulator YciM
LEIDATSAQAWYRLSALYRKTGQAAEAADAARHYRAIKDQQTNQEIESFRKQLLTSLDKQSNP